MNYKKGPALSPSKGFTIIELIVVIAIIAVLAAIVLVDVTRYINKSKDAAIQSNMSALNTVAVAYFAEHGDYSGMCNDPGVVSVREANNKIIDYAYLSCFPADYISCESSGWSSFWPLSDSTFWCVDYSGFSGVISSIAKSPDATCSCSNWVE